jgi:hypothetical protein
LWSPITALQPIFPFSSSVPIRNPTWASIIAQKVQETFHGCHCFNRSGLCFSCSVIVALFDFMSPEETTESARENPKANSDGTRCGSGGRDIIVKG